MCWAFHPRDERIAVQGMAGWVIAYLYAIQFPAKGFDY
jgi:hypothetical protein